MTGWACPETGRSWPSWPLPAAAYERPLAAGDAYTVELGTERIGTTSVTYVWIISGPVAICARGGHTVVHVDAAGKPAPLPAALRERLAGSRKRTATEN